MDDMIRREIEEIVEMFKRTELNEMEIEKDGLRLRLKKSPDGSHPAVVIPHSSDRAEGRLPREKGEPKTEKSEMDAGVTIKSPMVGTYYSAPSPESSPYVRAGDTVEPEQVVCIIEAMKLMNEIKAEIRGEITEVLVEDGHAVEFGQPLFVIRPGGDA